MKKKILIGLLLLSFLLSNANAGIFGFIKKNPSITVVGVGTAIYLNSIMHKSRDLSYNLPKVEEYFKINPQDFNPIGNYVLNALAKPNNKNDYDRYKRLAEVMGLDNIPPYVAPVNNGPVVLNNPIQEQNPADNILENPIQEEQFTNIIYTPQGEPIDTSTEFPIERPQSWEDYLLLKQDSTILGNNLEDSERMKNTNYVRPDNVAAHHLISATSPETKDARDILEKYLRNKTPAGEKTFNNEINGVLLPNAKNKNTSIPGIIHNGRHPKDYNIRVNQQINDADAKGGWIEVQKTLKDIKQSLLSANRLDKWKNLP